MRQVLRWEEGFHRTVTVIEAILSSNAWNQSGIIESKPALFSRRIRVPSTPSGKTEIESKEDARKRGQSSPDRAEALVMAFCKIVPQEQTIVFNERVQISQY
jgi:hypothetical protein